MWVVKLKNITFTNKFRSQKTLKFIIKKIEERKKKNLKNKLIYSTTDSKYMQIWLKNYLKARTALFLKTKLITYSVIVLTMPACYRCNTKVSSSKRRHNWFTFIDILKYFRKYIYKCRYEKYREAVLSTINSYYIAK